ncbi:0b3476e3-4c36-4ce8-b648-0fb38e27f47e [Sclerotinia trifoliorum]|uniref:Anaphase-promoting complex subunit 2 n=1 Tax=Sclerotinia trifoliorum TaxID=28548 RepID=A0A8H2W423_9HELO|nr:0b3476e3-4c36-4ce8-b648-0fb38e27f47e [Sclerotinia trifoliorum]
MATLTARRKRVFDSVFKKPEISEPTPAASPTDSFITPSQPFERPDGFNNEPKRTSSSNTTSSQELSGPIGDQSVDQVRDQIQWDRSWHTVTYRLQLSDVPPDPSSIEALESPSLPPDPSFDVALKDVLDSARRLPFAMHTEDLLVWHTQQVRRHLLHQILPILQGCTDAEGPESLVFGSVRILDYAHRRYLHGLSIILKQVDLLTPGLSRIVLEKFRRDLHAILSNSLTVQLVTAIKTVLENYVSSILGLQGGEGSGIAPIGARTDEVCKEMLNLVESLHKVGLAGENFQVIFAEIMNQSMTKYVNRGCRGLWSSNEINMTPEDGDRRNSVLPRTAHHVSPSNCVTDLCSWIEDRYSKLAVLVFKVIDNVEVAWSDMEKWKEMSIGRLAALRTDELFDIVVNWPNSNGALHDLRTTITTPQRRLHLTEVFAATLKERLLHPGASTLLILQTYISMIWSFHSLDHSKVLLDRVAYPLQVYLCSREDTVRIIITGLLSDTVDAQGNPIEPGGDRLIELAHLLNEDSEQSGRKIDDEELDWHDMEWAPDPVDAGPGYKRSKNADIIGTLIGFFGSQDVFIKEFQNIISENLLKNDGAFEKEIKVLELLKSRFGESPLQSCEVMLKDILDSVRLDLAIHKTQELSLAERKATPPPPSQPILHTKILSRLFWPPLQEASFTLPAQITNLQSHYSTAFSSLKPARKLTWLPALGHTTVELELADRTVVEECTTWQATVISCFHSETSGIDADEKVDLSKSIEELTSELQMESTLILSALKFWVSKLVLHEFPPNSQIYSVLETLNASERARSDALASATANADNNDDEGEGEKGEKGITGEHAKVYWQFVQSMLTNSSSQMGAPQIAMMLKMLIAEGFPYSNEELLEWLGGKVEEGALECAGGRYRLRK